MTHVRFCIQKRCLEIFLYEIRIVVKDLGKRCPMCEQIQDQ